MRPVTVLSTLGMIVPTVDVTMSRIEASGA